VFLGQAEAGRITMKPRWIPIAASAAMLFACPASAGPIDAVRGPEAPPVGLPATGPETDGAARKVLTGAAPTAGPALASTASPALEAEPSLATATIRVDGPGAALASWLGPRLESIRYRPRARYRERRDHDWGSHTRGFSQI